MVFIVFFPQVPNRNFESLSLKFFKTGAGSQSGIQLWLHFCLQNWETYREYIPFLPLLSLSSHKQSCSSKNNDTIYHLLIHLFGSLSNNEDYSEFWCPSTSHSYGASVKVTNRSHSIWKKIVIGLLAWLHQHDFLRFSLCVT